MKIFLRILTVAALLLPAAAVVADEPKADEPAPTTLSAVTVYEDRALVSRTAMVELPAGVAVVQLKDFPAALSEPSLRAFVEGEGVKVVSVTTRTEQRAEAVQEKLREADKAVNDLERARSRLVAGRKALDLEEAKLAEFAKLAREAIAERVTQGEADIEGFQKAAELFPKRQEALAEKRRGIDAEMESLDEKLKDARAQLAKVSSPEMKVLRTVTVSLGSVQATPCKLTVSYMVGNCGWSPRYEARLVGGKLRVAYQGAVRQKTGEDWQGVGMALSTARPALGAKRPELPRLRMATRKAEKTRKAVRSVEMTGVASYSSGYAVTADEPITEAEPTEVAARAEDTGVSVLFEVPGAANVPADGRSHRVPIMAFTDAEPALGFETVPKIVRHVYLRCDTANMTEFPMLAGPVDIWRESGFIGTSLLDFTPPKGKIALSLGVDENLKVRREKTHEAVRDNLVGSKRTHEVIYEIEVANYRDMPETVRVRENYPVSDVEEVKVEFLPENTPSKERDENNGLVMWEIAIPPEEKRTIKLAYTVTLPKDFAWRP